MLKAYADEHVPSAIVQALRLRGMDAITVQEHQGEGTVDAEVLAESLRERRIVLTSDPHFLALAAQLTERGATFAPIFFWPQSRRGIGEIMRCILREANRGIYEEMCSRVNFL